MKGRRRRRSWCFFLFLPLDLRSTHNRLTHTTHTHRGNIMAERERVAQLESLCDDADGKKNGKNAAAAAARICVSR